MDLFVTHFLYLSNATSAGILTQMLSYFSRNFDTSVVILSRRWIIRHVTPVFK